MAKLQNGAKTVDQEPLEADQEPLEVDQSVDRETTIGRSRTNQNQRERAC